MIKVDEKLVKEKVNQITSNVIMFVEKANDDELMGRIVNLNARLQNDDAEASVELGILILAMQNIKEVKEQ